MAKVLLVIAILLFIAGIVGFALQAMDASRIKQQNQADAMSYGPVTGPGADKSLARTYDLLIDRVYSAYFAALSYTKGFKGAVGDNYTHIIHAKKSPVTSIFSTYGENITISMQPLAPARTQVVVNSKSKLGTEMACDRQNTSNVYTILRAVDTQLFGGQSQWQNPPYGGQTQGGPVNQAGPYQGQGSQQQFNPYQGQNNWQNQTGSYQGQSGPQNHGQTGPAAGTAQQSGASNPTVILFCTKCGGKLRVPSNKGRLSITCPRCKNTFEWMP